MKNRTRSNRKERKRNEEMNLAYIRLQQCVPHIPADMKLAKIKILRLALRYIQHLQDVLEGTVMIQSSSSQELRPLSLEDFASVVMAEVQTKNNYKDLADRELKRGVRTEDICRQCVPERYASQQRQQQPEHSLVHFSSTISYQISSSALQNIPPQLSSFSGSHLSSVD